MAALRLAKDAAKKGANDQHTNNNYGDLSSLSDEIIWSIRHAIDAEVNIHSLNGSTMSALGLHRVFVT